MYEVIVEQHFEAAHYLRGYQGKCENLHGHNYAVKVRLRAKGLNEIGLAFDFTEVKKYLREIMGELDHICLNEIPPFKQVNPSAENIAGHIYRQLYSRLKEQSGVTVAAVEVWENTQQGVSFIPD